MYWTTLGRALGTLQNSRNLWSTDLHWLSITQQYLKTCFHKFACMFIWLYVFLPVSSSFFHFLPEETGRNTFFPVSSILPGRNLFLPEVSEPCQIVTFVLHFMNLLTNKVIKFRRNQVSKYMKMKCVSGFVAVNTYPFSDVTTPTYLPQGWTAIFRTVNCSFLWT